jgi:hypothetical protein
MLFSHCFANGPFRETAKQAKRPLLFLEKQNAFRETISSKTLINGSNINFSLLKKSDVFCVQCTPTTTSSTPHNSQPSCARQVHVQHVLRKSKYQHANCCNCTKIGFFMDLDLHLYQNRFVHGFGFAFKYWSWLLAKYLPRHAK